MIRAIGGVAAVVLGGMLLVVGCGSAATPKKAPVSSNPGSFVECSGARGPTYAILDGPGPDCKPLVAGQDYADGRVIIGLKPGTADRQLDPALAAYQATVIASHATLGDKVLAVPNGSVPQAVVGLARYSFITFAVPDLLAHINQKV